jgi:hypothetical protein
MTFTRLLSRQKCFHCLCFVQLCPNDDRPGSRANKILCRLISVSYSRFIGSLCFSQYHVSRWNEIAVIGRLFSKQNYAIPVDEHRQDHLFGCQSCFQTNSYWCHVICFFVELLKRKYKFIADTELHRTEKISDLDFGTFRPLLTAQRLNFFLLACECHPLK